MPITLPNLDDRTFEELVAAAKQLIPIHAPSWTDHNTSDPGITLVELFAFLTEMHLYRANRISEPANEAFVRLLRGEPEWTITKSIEEEIRDAVRALRQEDRAVTVEDFQTLALRNPGVARAHCLPGVHAGIGSFSAPSHISVLVVPNPAPSNSTEDLIPSPALVSELLKDLRPRCLLTTRLHVVGPSYVTVKVNLRARIFAEQSEEAIEKGMRKRLSGFFHPLHGGKNGQGWPFGGAVYTSDVLACLDGVPGVDWVEAIQEEDLLSSAGPSRILDNDRRLIGLQLQQDQLVRFDPSSSFKFTQHRELFPQQ